MLLVCLGIAVDLSLDVFLDLSHQWRYTSRDQTTAPRTDVTAQSLERGCVVPPGRGSASALEADTQRASEEGLVLLVHFRGRGGGFSLRGCGVPSLCVKNRLSACLTSAVSGRYAIHYIRPNFI